MTATAKKPGAAKKAATRVDLGNPAHLAVLASEAARSAAHWSAGKDFAADAKNYRDLARSARALIECPGDEDETADLEFCLAAERGNILGRVHWLLNRRDAAASYSEAAYFDGNACQHCADREERQRLERKRRAAAGQARVLASRRAR